MEQNENTNSVPGQNQSPDANALETQEEQPKSVQSDIDDHGTLEVELPGKPNIEPARKCQICGSPNHHACGCEARTMKEKTRITIPKREEQPEEDITDEIAETILSNEFVKEARNLGIQQTKDIQSMAAAVKSTREFFEGALACLQDGVQYLKVIADDVITIRKSLKDEYKESENKDQPET